MNLEIVKLSHLITCQVIRLSFVNHPQMESPVTIPNGSVVFVAV